MHRSGIFAALAALLLALPALADEEVSARPAIWHVKGPRGQATIFGSFHVLPANMNWLTPEITQAIRAASVFVFEVPTDDEAHDALNRLIATHASLPSGQSLRALLPQNAQTDYDTALAAAHLRLSVVDSEQPWLVSLQLGIADDVNRSFFPDAGADYVLMSWANAHRRRVQYLESVDEQFAMIEPSDSALRLEEFQKTLHGFGQSPSYLPPMIEAWRTGDVPRLDQLFNALFDGRPDRKQRLVTNRNHKWVHSIEDMLAQDRSYFITVGAAHLPGPEGVIALLRTDGYTVEGP